MRQDPECPPLRLSALTQAEGCLDQLEAQSFPLLISLSEMMAPFGGRPSSLISLGEAMSPRTRLRWSSLGR